MDSDAYREHFVVILRFVNLQNANLAKHVAHCLMIIYHGNTGRVRRSYSRKAKLSENEGFFCFEAKKNCFFRFVRMQAKDFKKLKK
jgi:hypothetical protein